MQMRATESREKVKGGDFVPFPLLLAGFGAAPQVRY